MLENNYKKVMKKIKLSQEKKDEIYEKILNKQVKKNYFNPIVIAIVICLVTVFGTLGTVYAEEIKNAINTILMKRTYNEEKHATKLESNGLAIINYNANIPEVESKTKEEISKGIVNEYYSYEELEKLLEIKLLKSDYFKNNMLYQNHTKKENGKISEAGFSIKNFTDVKGDLDNVYSMGIYIKTKYAPEEIQNLPYYEISGSFLEEEYFIKSLNTNAYIFKTDCSNSSSCFVQTWQIKFVYENICYSFKFQFINETTEFIRSEIFNILESLYL